MSAVLEPIKGPPARESTYALSRALSRADGVLQRERGACWILRAWPWVFGAVIAAFSADVIWHLGPYARLALGLGVLALLGLVFAVGAWIGFIRRNSAEYTARILEGRASELGSKLINCLQLQAQADDPRLQGFTRELAAAAVSESAAKIDQSRLLQVAHTNAVQREAKRAGWGLVGFLAILGICWPVTATEIPRFLDPFGDHPPFSLTRIAINSPNDDTSEVDYGQSTVVSAAISGHRPSELFLTFHPPKHPELAVTLPMFDKAEAGFAQQIASVKTPLIVVAHTKNRHAVSKQRFIGVGLTPKLDRAFLKITPPAYTGLPPEESALQFKSIKALAGSRLEFRLLSNRPLRAGSLEVIKSPQSKEDVMLESRGENEVAGSMTANESARLRFSIVDRDGHASQETWEASLSVSFDLPPEVDIKNPVADSFVAEDFVVDSLIEATDDYGIKTLRIHRSRGEKWEAPEVIQPEKPQRYERAARALNLRELGYKPGDTMTMFAEAIDTYPDPHLTRSRSVTLTVISTEDYNSFLRERTDMANIQAKFAQLADKLRELAEQQRELGAQAEKAKEQMEKVEPGAAKEALEKKLNELQAKQNEVNNKLNKLADSMDSFVREQPLYDIESELQDVLSEQAEKIRESTKENQATNEQIAKSDPAAGAQKPMQDFKQASDQQLEKLGAAEQQAQEQIDQPLGDLAQLHEIMKSMNRVGELSAAQKELAKQAKAYEQKKELSREDQLAMKQLAATQNAIGEELDAVEKKLREDGKAAGEKFPKAGESAQLISDELGRIRLQRLAPQATSAMLAGEGARGAQLSQSLSEELDGLFCEACKKAGNQMSGELDQFLKLTRGMKPGNNFKQMMQTKMSGQNKGRVGKGGEGTGGSDGFAMSAEPETPVLGNESRINKDARSGSKPAQTQATEPVTKPDVALDATDVARDVKSTNRESGAVEGEAAAQQYRELVERYFKAISK